MAEPSPAVQCPKCGHAFTDPLNFCPKCGADLRGVGGYTETFSGTLKGKVIADRYKLIERLGEGGMGAVYKVQHTRMGKVMALKLLRPELSKQGAALERFRQEAQLVATLSSLHTISIFDFGEAEDGALYLAMEYLPGSDLSHVLRTDGCLPEARVAEIGIQVCRSLAEAHDNGIIHRDIKPANVMLLRTREKQDLVKVLDFGIAKLRLRRGDGAITGVGDFVGTPEYLSPEQARGEELTPASDIYSLGAMLYELACGVPVFDGPTPLSIVSRHLTDLPVPPHKRTPSIRVSETFEAVLLKALEKKPADRFASADEMRAALEPLAGLRPVPAFDKAPRDTGDLGIASRQDWDRFERRLRRGLWLRNLAALAAVAVLATGTAWYVRRLLSAPPRPLTEELEPNDRPSEANLVGSGLPIRGHIGARFSDQESDKDFFRIQVAGDNQLLRAEVTGVPGMALVLDLYGPKQKTPLTRADEGTVGAGLVIPDWPVEEGTYYLKLRARVPPGQVPPENVSDWYTLTASISPRLAGEEKRPNFTPDTASRATLSRPALGFAGGAGELAYFGLDPLSKGSDVEGVKLAAIVSPVPGADLRLVAGRAEWPAGTAGWVPSSSGRLPRVVAVKVASGVNATDMFTLAFFTPKADGGGALVGAVRRLISLGRRDAAVSVVAGAAKLVPDAPWAPALQAALAGH